MEHSSQTQRVRSQRSRQRGRQAAFARTVVAAILLASIVVLGGPVRVLSAPQAQGKQFAPGDVLVSVGYGVEWYTPYGNLVKTLYASGSSSTAGVAYNNSNQRLYVVASNSVNVFDSFGNWIGYFGSEYEYPESILFDNFRNVYVGQSNASLPLIKFNPAGNPISRYALDSANSGAGRFDLASDQCTVYYTGDDLAVSVFNLCTYTSIPTNVNNGLEPYYRAHGLRLLPDGSLLVANEYDIRRIDVVKGSRIQTYDVEYQDNWSEISLAPDGKSFWSTSGTEVYQFEISSGRVLTNFSLGYGKNVTGLAVISAPPVVPPTPTFTPTITRTPTPTGTTTEPELPPIITPSDTPPATTEGPTQPPEQPATPIPAPPRPTSVPPLPGPPSDILIDILIFIAVVGAGAGVWLIRRAVKSTPRTKGKAGYRQTRVKMQIHEDAGSQVVEAAADKSAPQIRLRSGQGRVDYSIEPDDPNRDRGGQP